MLIPHDIDLIGEYIFYDRIVHCHVVEIRAKLETEPTSQVSTILILLLVIHIHPTYHRSPMYLIELESIAIIRKKNGEKTES